MAYQLRIWWCHCCGSGLIPGLELLHAKDEAKKEKKNVIAHVLDFRILSYGK